MGLFQLEQDFKKIFEDFSSNNYLPQGNPVDYNTLFSEKWPSIAKKVLAKCKKVRIDEVQTFMKTNQKLVDAGKIKIYQIPRHIIIKPIRTCNY